MQYLGVLTRVRKGGEVIQQGDAGQGGYREASIDEAPYESSSPPLSASACNRISHTPDSHQRLFQAWKSTSRPKIRRRIYETRY